MASTSTTVRHVTKDHVVITPAKGYSVVVFIGRVGGDAEAIITSDDGNETVRLIIDGPGLNQTMSIKTDEFGVVDIVYDRKP
jgi:hypothetical protein